MIFFLIIREGQYLNNNASNATRTQETLGTVNTLTISPIYEVHLIYDFNSYFHTQNLYEENFYTYSKHH